MLRKVWPPWLGGKGGAEGRTRGAAAAAEPPGAWGYPASEDLRTPEDSTALTPTFLSGSGVSCGLDGPSLGYSMVGRGMCKESVTRNDERASTSDTKAELVKDGAESPELAPPCFWGSALAMVATDPFSKASLLMAMERDDLRSLLREVKPV